MGRETLTIEEAAKRLGISPRHAYTLARRGELPVLRLGHRWVVLAAGITKMLEAQIVDAKPMRVPIVEA